MTICEGFPASIRRTGDRSDHRHSSYGDFTRGTEFRRRQRGGHLFRRNPTTNSAGLVNDTNVDIRLVDIERVEVLRGPQGTSYGSSSLGGAVRTIPVAPKLDRFEGKAGIGYSTTAENGGDNYALQAVANIPLIKDKLAVRAVGYKFRDTGFYRNDAGTDQLLATAVIQRYRAPDAAVSSEEAGTVEVRGGRAAAAFRRPMTSS